MYLTLYKSSAYAFIGDWILNELFGIMAAQSLQSTSCILLPTNQSPFRSLYQFACTLAYCFLNDKVTFLISLGFFFFHNIKDVKTFRTTLVNKHSFYNFALHSLTHHFHLLKYQTYLAIYDP